MPSNPVFCVVTWLFHFSILKVSAWKNAMGAMAKRPMGATAKRRPWQKDALENCYCAHGKKVMNHLKGILSGLHGTS